MSRRWKSLSAASAALAIAVGLLLPQAVLLLKDRQLSNQVDTYETAPVKFYASRQITDTLKLLAENYSTLSLPVSYARMHMDQVYEGAQAFLNSMEEAGLFPEAPQALSPASAAPSLYVRNGSAADLAFYEPDAQEDSAPVTLSRTSAIVWDCTLTGENGASVRLTVDDATGLVTSVSCWPGQADEETAALEDKWEQLRYFAAGCSDFFSKYYGLEAGDIQYTAYPDRASLRFFTPEQETVCLELTIQGHAFSIWTGQNFA